MTSSVSLSPPSAFREMTWSVEGEILLGYREAEGTLLPYNYIEAMQKKQLQAKLEAVFPVLSFLSLKAKYLPPCSRNVPT